MSREPREMEPKVGPTTRWRRRWAHAGVSAAVVGVAGLVGAGVWTGCTVTERNYATLSFFFDGVPAPAGTIGPDGRPAAVVSLSVHKPYAEDNCDACHQGRLKMSRRDSSVCLTCHEDEREKHAYLHGPVAAGECLWCHQPHESAFKHLLRDTDRNVCTSCHAPGLLSSRWVPAHNDPARACLECHTGHGGAEPFLLRGGIERARQPDAPSPGAGGAQEKER